MVRISQAPCCLHTNEKISPAIILHDGNHIQRQYTISKTKDVCHVNSFCCSLLMSVLHILKERGRGRRRGEMKVVYDLSLVCACTCVSPISKCSVCNLLDVIMLVLSQRFKDKSKQTICRLISLKKCKLVL